MADGNALAALVVHGVANTTFYGWLLGRARGVDPYVTFLRPRC